MELRQLRYFLSVADARSFAGAAGELFVSRQAVSKAISSLESELNVELFFRDSNGAYLTPAGMTFYDRVRGSVMDLEKVGREIRQSGTRYMQHVHAVFTVGALRLYEAALLKYRNTQKNTNVSYAEMTDEACFKQLADHKADMAVTAVRPDDPACLCEEIFTSPYGVLMRAQPETDGESVSIGDLKWLPLAGMSDASTERLCAQNGLTLSYSGYDCYRLFELAARGVCALLLPRALVPVDDARLSWSSVEEAPVWRLYRVIPRSLDDNTLYRMVLDDLTQQVMGV